VEIFGSGRATAVDCQAAAGQEAFGTVYREFAEAVGRGGPNELDAQRGLHVQQMIEAAKADRLGSRRPAWYGTRRVLSSDRSGRIAADGPR
jgi:predicted dehydrogenase